MISGIGLRQPHFRDVLETKPRLDFFEVISENFVETGGRPRQILHDIRKDYPVFLHGVNLNIGGLDPIHPAYLQALRRLSDEIQPALISDHLCWTTHQGQTWYDLLPLPFREDLLTPLVDRIAQVQDFLKRPIALENISTYLRFKDADMSELDFILQIIKRSGCQLLLDVNNVFVNAYNHGFNAQEFIQNLPTKAIAQYHLAGHTQQGDFLFDTHDQEISKEVWDLFDLTLSIHGSKPTLIERDNNIPKLHKLLEEAYFAEQKVKELKNGTA